MVELSPLCETAPTPPKSGMRRNPLSFTDLFDSATNLPWLEEEHADPAAQCGDAAYGATAKSPGLAARAMSPPSRARNGWSPETVVCEPVSIPGSSRDSEDDTRDEEMDAYMDALIAARHERHAQIGLRRFY